MKTSIASGFPEHQKLSKLFVALITKPSRSVSTAIQSLAVSTDRHIQARVDDEFKSISGR